MNKATAQDAICGVIGGSQLTQLDGMSFRRELRVDTPFGPTSAPITHGSIGDTMVAFLPRHGVPHTVPPHKVNYRANIWALREIGVQRIVAVATVGGLNLRHPPGTLVLPDQIIDYTNGRSHTFSEGTEHLPLVHVDFTHPFSVTMRRELRDAARRLGIEAIDGGCYACCNGPRLETAAEVRKYAREGCDLVGQTLMPEAGLARELGLEYAAICPIVNHAAGVGESQKGIEREALNKVRERLVGSIVRVLTEFLRAQNSRAA